MVTDVQLGIWQSIMDRYNYGEYLAKCKELDVGPLNVLEFGKMTGIAGVATVMHYELPLPEAYAKILELEINEIPRYVAEQSRGFGDTVAKITHSTGLDKLAELYTKITGKPCGCNERQDALNKLFPYGVREDE